MDTKEEARKVLDPILQVFGGSDGGAAFAHLRHSFLPEMYSKFEDNTHVAELIRTVEKFSKLCELMLDYRT